MGIGILGGFMPLWVDKISKMAVHLAYAFAGGILGAVALVHMLDDASSDLEDVGASFAKALSNGKSDGFPMGIFLFLVGFFLISTIESILHHTLGHHEYDHSGHGDEGKQGMLTTEKASAANAAGWATLVGLTIHSFFEGVAMGVPTDESEVGALVIAVAAHKGFAAFACSSINMPLRELGKSGLWVFIVMWFALTGPVGMMIGLALTSDLDSVGVAVVTALAAGSVLSVGVTEMLLPALKDPEGLGWKLLAAWVGMLAMSLLGVWA